MSSELKNLSAYNAEEIPSAKGFRFAIVRAEWNSEITNPLLDGCVKTLVKHGAKETDIKVLQVPGSFELSFACSELAYTKNFDAIIAIGCIIEGETRHFEFIANAIANGITKFNGIMQVLFIGCSTDAAEHGQVRIQIINCLLVGH